MSPIVIFVMRCPLPAEDLSGPDGDTGRARRLDAPPKENVGLMHPKAGETAYWFRFETLDCPADYRHRNDVSAGGVDSAMRLRRSSKDGEAGAERSTDAGHLQEMLAPVAMALPEWRVSPDLWRRIEAAVDAADVPERPTAVDVPREEGWRPYTRDVQIKRLWDENTFLLRCGPGAVLPAHEHPRYEHCVILEGDMIVGGKTYRSGDYHGVPAHIAHQEITSRTGLLMLVRYQ
jgi:anti-sigma factor ChrR (cupin superfamily)